jgi:hypothetical protein
LRLTLVALFRYPEGADSVNYLFGTVRDRHGRLALGVPGTRYLIVSEARGHLRLGGMTIVVGHGPYGSTGRQVEGPWDLSANIPNHHLTLHVHSVLSRAAVLHAGNAILAAAASR